LFVILTSRDREEDRARAEAADVDRYLIKGDVPAELLRGIVTELLESA
jgi:CheY-like chemotaxis protein